MATFMFPSIYFLAFFWLPRQCCPLYVTIWTR